MATIQKIIFKVNNELKPVIVNWNEEKLNYEFNIPEKITLSELIDLVKGVKHALYIKDD